MRPINLLPVRYQPLRGTGRRSGVAYIATGVLAVLLLMVVLYVVTDNGIKDAEEKTAEAKAEEATALARVGALKPYGDFATLRIARESAVRAAAGQRFDYERLLREMALLLPDDTYLTSLSASAGGSATAAAAAPPTGATGATTPASGSAPGVAVAGCAPNHPTVADSVVRLRKLHNVTDVTLVSSTRGGTGTTGGGGASSVCRVSWSATLQFKAEQVTPERGRIPSRLGGGP